MAACADNICGNVGLIWFGVVLAYIVILALVGILTFYIGYHICLLVPKLNIPPIPSPSQFMTFASFGSVLSSTLFLIVIGSLLCYFLSSNRTPANEYQRLCRRYKKHRYTAFALIISGPFWGAMIGVFGVLLDAHNKTDSRIGMQFGTGIAVGAVGGAVLLTVLGGLLLIWTSWGMRQLNKRFDEKARKSIVQVVKLQPRDIEDGLKSTSFEDPLSKS